MFIFIAILQSIGGVVLLTFVPFLITMFSYAWLKKKKISAVTSGEQTAIATSLLLLAFLVSLPHGLEWANVFIKDYLANIDLEKKIFESPSKNQKIMFIEGPPTMNGIPHAGHLRGRVMKDLWYRYMTLKGNKVVFNAGWDTQGLPVELQAEKELGVTGGKTQIIKSVGRKYKIGF